MRRIFMLICATGVMAALAGPQVAAQQPRDPRGATPNQILQRVAGVVTDTFKTASRDHKPRIPAICSSPVSQFTSVLDCYLTTDHLIGSFVNWYTFQYQRDGTKTVETADYQYQEWTDAEKNDLREAFDAARKFGKNGFRDYAGPALEDVPVNQDPITYDFDVKTALDEKQQAWPIYIATVGMMLAAEVDEWYPWSLHDYDWSSLGILLDGTKWFHPSAGIKDLGQEHSLYPGAMMVRHAFEETTPAPPALLMAFIGAHRLIGDSPLTTVEKMLDWSRWNLSHFIGGWDAANLEAHWQYRGLPPVTRILQGTPWPFPQEQAQFPGLYHWTAGCHGTEAFLKAMFRVLNIPTSRVRTIATDGHTSVYFPELDAYLAHGDDPYDPRSKSIHPFPARLLLVDSSTYNTWLPADGSGKINIDRRPADLMVLYPTQFLADQYCGDLKAGRSHGAGDVFTKNFSKYGYTVPALEGLGLWGRLDNEVASQGLSCQ
jgi:hypothetical protein